jgi:C4-dicarboxylate transporter, DctM subunit
VLFFSIFGLFLAIALVGVPLVYALLATTVLIILGLGRFYPLEAVYLTFLGGIEGLHYVAIPLFILAGELVGRGGVGRRMVDLARALFGWLPGGLGVVTVAGCLLFGAVSGSAVAAAAAIGTVMVPGMTGRGYPRPYAAALVASAGTLGVIIPPSIPMLIYGFVGDVSVKDLFISGIVPGLLFGLGLMLVCMWKGRAEGWDPGGARPSWREILPIIWECLPALAMPVVILGGIYSGVFTPTEAAAMAVIYGFLVAMLVYRELSFREIPGIILDSFVTSAVVMLVIGATASLAWLITLEQVPVQLTEIVKEISSSKWVFLLLLNVSLLVLGIFLEPVPALILTAPLFIPTAKAFGVDPVHLGLIMTCNLAIGLYTPPVGGTLFVAANIANVGMGAISRALTPLFLVSVAVLFLITYIEWLSLGLVRLLR